MDCRQVNLILRHPDRFPEDSHSETWTAVGEHLETCQHCDAAFRHAEPLDTQIAAAMSAVAVPSDGPARLLDQLAALTPETPTVGAGDVAHAPDASNPDRSSPTDAVQSRSRRGWWITATAIAVCAAVSVWVWFAREPAPRLSLQVLRNEAPVTAEQIAALPQFDPERAGFEASLPQVGWSHLRVSRVPHEWMALNVEPVAVYSFAGPERRGRPAVRGALLVVRRSAVSEIPGATTFSTGNVVYTTRAGTHFATVGWTEGDLVYVCMVENRPGSLDTLQQLLTGSTV